MYFAPKKTAITSLICACFFVCFTSITAQTSGDCFTVVPICADGVITTEVDGAGDVEDFEDISQSGCLEKGGLATSDLEKDVAWFIFRANGDGQLGFNIRYLSANEDWDFAVYGPNADCNNLGEPVRCSYESGVTGYTGVGINPATGTSQQEGDEYDTWLDVQQGEEYIIFINNFNTNFTGDPMIFELEFTGPLLDAQGPDALDCSIKEDFLGPDINACVGDVVTLDAERQSATNYEWYVDGNLIAGENGPTLNVTTTGLYSVIVTTPVVTFEDEIQVTFHPILQPSQVGYQVTDLQDINTISVTVMGTSEYEYSLNGGTFQSDPEFIDVPPGINQLTVRDVYGCGEVIVNIPVVGYPRFFTPNGDSINDEWHIGAVEELNFAYITIYDRYGKLLAQLDRNSTGWDGTYNGKPLPATDYWFKFNYTRDVNGETQQGTIKGHFTLKR